MEDTFECWFYKGNNQRRKCKKGQLQLNRDVGVRFVVSETSGGFRSIFGLKRKKRRIFAIPMRDLLKVKRCKTRKNTLILYTRGSTRMMELTAPSMAVMAKWEMALNGSIRRYYRDKNQEKMTAEDIRKLIAKDQVGEEHEAFMRETSKYRAGYVRVEICARGMKLDRAEQPWRVHSLLIHTGRGEITMEPMLLNESKDKTKRKNQQGTVVHSLQDTLVVAIDPRTGHVMENDVKIDMDVPLVVAVLPKPNHNSSSKTTSSPTEMVDKARRVTRRRSSLFQRLASFSFGRGGEDRSIDDLSSTSSNESVLFLSCPHHRLPISSRPSDVVVKTEMVYKKDPFPLASILKSMSFSGSALSKPLSEYVRRAEKLSISPPSSPRRGSLSPRHRRASTVEVSKRQIETLPEYTTFLAVSLWLPVWEDEHAAHVSHSCAQAVHDEENMDISMKSDKDVVPDLRLSPPKLIVSKKTIEYQKPPICLGHWSVSYLKDSSSSSSSSSTCQTFRVCRTLFFR